MPPTDTPSAAAAIPKTSPQSPQSAAAAAAVVVPPRGLTLTFLRDYTDDQIDAELRTLGITMWHMPAYRQTRLIADIYAQRRATEV